MTRLLLPPSLFAFALSKEWQGNIDGAFGKVKQEHREQVVWLMLAINWMRSGRDFCKDAQDSTTTTSRTRKLDFWRRSFRAKLHTEKAWADHQWPREENNSIYIEWTCDWCQRATLTFRAERTSHASSATRTSDVRQVFFSIELALFCFRFLFFIFSFFFFNTKHKSTWSLHFFRSLFLSLCNGWPEPNVLKGIWKRKHKILGWSEKIRFGVGRTLQALDRRERFKVSEKKNHSNRCLHWAFKWTVVNFSQQEKDSQREWK